MDIARLYQDFNVVHATSKHKHARDGWVNTTCPFCVGNPGFHLGWNIYDEYFYCWRCGWHPPVKTIAAILKKEPNEVRLILQDYGVNRTLVKRIAKKKKTLVFPTGTTELKETHKKYLRNRGFNPEKITKDWKLKATGPTSYVEKSDYRYRIIIPYYWNGEIVSWSTRDVTGKQENKYKACPQDRELIEHKKILYGNQEFWESTGIGVEGPFDVWRLGTQSCAFSGIKYSRAQVKIIARTFKRFVVIFDDDPQAQVQAEKLVSDLRFRNVDAKNLKIKGDPADLQKYEIQEIMKNIKTWHFI